MGHAVGPEFKAQMDLGTTMPYISPPLIHARLPGRIKEPKKHSRLGKLTGRDLGGYGNPLIRSRKTRCPGALGSAIIIT